MSKEDKSSIPGLNQNPQLTPEGIEKKLKSLPSGSCVRYFLFFQPENVTVPNYNKPFHQDDGMALEAIKQKDDIFYVTGGSHGTHIENEKYSFKKLNEELLESLKYKHGYVSFDETLGESTSLWGKIMNLFRNLFKVG
jgi:hypothetical protein